LEKVEAVEVKKLALAAQTRYADELEAEAAELPVPYSNLIE
jgi:hypothetical protein